MKDAILGKPEGREGVWLLDYEDAVVFVQSLPGEEIHNFLDGGIAMLGANWSKKSVVELLRRPGHRIGMIFPPQMTMKHQLVVLSETKRWSFDVGEIPESRMAVKP